VLVTGANAGIGLAVSTALVQQGHHVFLGCRSEARCEAAAGKLGEHAAAAAAGGSVTVVAGLDLADLGVGEIRSQHSPCAAGCNRLF
jgi:NADP-dependent 3-hydroxy acid dehydrogenase YdfG